MVGYEIEPVSNDHGSHEMNKKRFRKKKLLIYLTSIEVMR